MFLISCICGILFPFRIRAEDNSGTDLQGCFSFVFVTVLLLNPITDGSHFFRFAFYMVSR